MAAPRHAPAEPPLPPGSTIGILGGGQLGRMLGMAARRLGYRIVIVDPDPDAPAAVLADKHLVAGYGDTDAAGRLAAVSAVVTCELEHVDVATLAALAQQVPVRPSPGTIAITQDRLAERRWLESVGAPVARWRPIHAPADLPAAAAGLGFPSRLKVAVGGYDGRQQASVGRADQVDAAYAALEPSGRAVLLEQEIDFACELSVVCARGLDRSTVAYPVAQNRHDRGILIESIAPAPIPELTADAAQELAVQLADALDIVGTLTVELFLLRDGSLLVNELAPRVHNSGHYTEAACVTSQFEQHVRAICGLPLGSVAMRDGSAAMVNLLGTGERRTGRPLGLEAALADPGVHVHLYGKRDVAERRKMGHVTVVDEDAQRALERARRSAAHISWAQAAWPQREAP